MSKMRKFQKKIIVYTFSFVTLLIVFVQRSVSVSVQTFVRPMEEYIILWRTISLQIQETTSSPANALDSITLFNLVSTLANMFVCSVVFPFRGFITYILTQTSFLL